MTTKPSAAPWADEPYKLIKTSKKAEEKGAHSAYFCAKEMALAHNALIRGLNSILQQAPHVPDSSSSAYNAQDVMDLLFYTHSWVKMTEHHHMTEETTMFPSFDKLSGKTGLMSGAEKQHEEFTGGMKELAQYTERMQERPETYSWPMMKGLIDGFAPSMVNHLYEEIDMILGLEAYDSDGLMNCWKEAEKVAKANGQLSLLYDVFPCVLGNCDKTYEGGNEFPPLPGILPYAIKYWFGAGNSGAWRFNPCDFWGKPRPLVMLPENRVA